METHETYETHNQKPAPKQELTAAFSIAIVIGIILFLILINKLPFPADYHFGNYLGICIVCFVGCALLFGISSSIITGIYKILVEIAVVFLLFTNVCSIAVFWALFSQFRYDAAHLFDTEITAAWPAVILFGVVMFIYNLLYVLFILPHVRIAKSPVLDIDG
jgi:hypothetical protein